MSVWIHSGNSSLDTGEKGDLPLNGNPLLETESVKEVTGLHLGISNTFTFDQMVRPAEGEGSCQKPPPHNAVSNMFEGGGKVLFFGQRRRKLLWQQ